ncbi:hypothetical protein GGS23DRAFT_589476 [Durotheca rogersii]|uniref:uncharacterized protein n=1 Tax=Durotheca rogersii TaxID=419775 RepID=UPI002220850C|nr:uncharacterized protein GGS23DRAFT_589476 [Durotheca rogersii]KAI5855586.1 hypothetical protein GGS23DRAFT_589476 [Durotheca rogersii]
MDRSTLQAPKPGRSRFSKALPAPPPGLEDDRPPPASRDLSSLPRSPFPPRKDSVTVRTSNNSISASVKPNLTESTLPAPPPKSIVETPRPQMQPKLIPRKPVGLPTTPTPTTAPKPKHLKRVSSISSILSAYSHTSSGSVQRSSQDSIFTKDSEPANSPDRPGVDDVQQSISKSAPSLPNNPGGYEKLEISFEVGAIDLQPPISIKDVTRSSTSSGDRQQGASSGQGDGALALNRDPPAPTPTTLDDTPQRQEIWRRRASSKTDGSILIPGLVLETPHTSNLTSTPSQPINKDPTPSQSVNTDLIPPPAPKRSNDSPAILLPRSGSLPGRNIRPTRQAESQGQHETRKFNPVPEELTQPGETRKGAGIPGEIPAVMDEYSESSLQTDAKMNVTSPANGQPVSGRNSREAPKNALDTVLSPSSVVSSSSSEGNPVVLRAIGGPLRSQVDLGRKGSSPDLRMHGRGIPSHPRPSRSSSSLRSVMTPSQAQESARTKTIPQVNPPPVMSVSSPPGSNEPPQMPELYRMVSRLTEPLSDINEFTEMVIDEQTEKLNEAVARFHRNINRTAPVTDVVWQAKPLTIQHYECFARHTTWLPVKNTNYTLSCQTCGAEDKSWRRTCAFCSLRICIKCHEQLMLTHNSDLKALMGNMQTDLRENERRWQEKKAE